MIGETKNNKIFPGFSKNLAQLFVRFGRKGKMPKTANLKALGKRRSDWLELLK